MRRISDVPSKIVKLVEVRAASPGRWPAARALVSTNSALRLWPMRARSWHGPRPVPIRFLRDVPVDPAGQIHLRQALEVTSSDCMTSATRRARRNHRRRRSCLSVSGIDGAEQRGPARVILADDGGERHRRVRGWPAPRFGGLRERRHRRVLSRLGVPEPAKSSAHALLVAGRHACTGGWQAVHLTARRSITAI
jgi:hypothetical protein